MRKQEFDDDIFAANPLHNLYTFVSIERNDVLSLIHFVERKQFQSEICVGQLVSQNIVWWSDFLFKNIKRTPQYFHNMLLNVPFQIRQFCVYTSILTCSATEFHRTEIIKIVAQQYGEALTDKEL